MQRSLGMADVPGGRLSITYWRIQSPKSISYNLGNWLLGRLTYLFSVPVRVPPSSCCELRSRNGLIIYLSALPEVRVVCGMWSMKSAKRGKMNALRGWFAKPVRDFTLDDFYDKTTLPGLAQVFTRTNRVWKIFWMVVAVAGVTMSLYQSWDVMMDFSGGRTVQFISFSSAHSVDFPTVVVCSNVRVHHSKLQSLIPKVCAVDAEPKCFREYEEVSDEELKIRGKLMKNLFKLVAQYNITERRKHFYDVRDKFLADCDRESKACNNEDPDEVFFFNTIYHGRCFVYNRGYNKVITGSDAQDLILKLNMDRLSRGMEANELYASVWVSPPGVAPSFFSDSGTRIYAGDRVKIRFTTRNIVRLNGTPATPYCIDSKEPHWLKFNLLNTDELQYIYDQSACRFFYEDAERRKRNCYNPGVDYSNWAEALESDNITICSLRDCPDYCTEHASDELVAKISRKCATPCREQVLSHNVNTMSLWLESLVEKSLLNASVVDNEGMSMGTIVFNESTAIIEIAPWSTVVEEISEVYKYSLADFFGILGGNIGLWIGVSVVSLTELLELAFILLTTKKVPDKTSIVAVHKIKKSLNPMYVTNVGKRRPLRI